MNIFFTKTTNSNGRPLSVACNWFSDFCGFTEDIEKADCVIICTEGYVSSKQWFIEKKRFPGKELFLYSESDYPNLAIRGFYPSIYKKTRGCVSIPYLIQSHPLPDSSRIKKPNECTTKISFKGRCETHNVRMLLESKYLQFVNDTKKIIKNHPIGKNLNHCGYCDLLSNTIYILCPRGFGASSYRLYESMSWGCIPVIISDQFNKPEVFEDWSNFSISIKESDINKTIDGYAFHCEEMIYNSRRVWERCFSSTGLWAYIQYEISNLLKFPEFNNKENLINRLDKFHFGAWSREIF
ncbi:MAG: hypothetical protein CFE38_08215 [Comamonadaceae bacterium PBBC1]|nr:MAG: hypothetical protein CFE38_08215 [Comamonadaceae bacterium PBBC1]